MPDVVESVAGGVRAVVLAWARVQGRIFRDQAPSNCTFPYVTFFELSGSPVLNGDGRALSWTRGVQVSLWQKQREESRELLSSLVNALNGQTVQVPNAAVYICRINDTNRILDPAGEVVQDAITLAISHDSTTQ